MSKTWEDIKEHNQSVWGEIFNQDTDTLIDNILQGKDSIIEGDKDVIYAYNNSPRRNEISKFELSVLPEPYRGNLKDPKLVILSLNPGYVERLNRTLFEKLSKESQREFVDTLKRNVMLEDGSKLVFNDVDEIIGDGYWSEKLAELKKIDSDLFSKIALIQYNPYFSRKYSSWAGEGTLASQQFAKEIIARLMEQSDVQFLVMRSKKQWEQLIGFNMDEDLRFILNHNPICQSISKNNLDGNRGTNYYEQIKEALK